MSTHQTAVTTTYKVAGMTCGHCENAVREELMTLEEVAEVSASAKDGLVTVSSSAELDESAVRTAIDEAGYDLTGRA